MVGKQSNKESSTSKEENVPIENIYIKTKQNSTKKMYNITNEIIAPTNLTYQKKNITKNEPTEKEEESIISSEASFLSPPSDQSEKDIIDHVQLLSKSDISTDDSNQLDRISPQESEDDDDDTKSTQSVLSIKVKSIIKQLNSFNLLPIPKSKFSFQYSDSESSRRSRKKQGKEEPNHILHFQFKQSIN